MTGRAEVTAAQQRVITIAVDIVATERHLADDDRAANLLPTLDEALAYAVRDMANAVAELLPGERPKDWDLSWDGDTA